MSRIGSIGEFEPKSEPWSSYVERLELFFAANDIKKEKQASVLLTFVGRETYGLIRNLAAPEKPSSKTYDQLVELVKRHIDPKPNETVERYKFHHRKQLENECIADYVAELMRMSLKCNFGESLDTSLRDKFVDGLKDANILEQLLAKPRLTFKTAVEFATSLEVAMKDARELQGENVQDVNRLWHGRNARKANREKGTEEKASPQGKKKSCHRCGKSNHNENDCFSKSRTCHKCGKKGHFQTACQDRSKGSWNAQKKGSLSHSTNHVTTHEQDVETFYAMTSKGFPKPITVSVEISGKILEMEIDTGSPVSVINTKTYETYLRDVNLHPAGITLKPYKGNEIIPEGKAEVDICYNGQKKRHDLYVVKDGGAPILGRAWLEDFQVDWHQVHHVRAERLTLKGLLQKHKALFEEGLGKLKNFKAKLCINEDAQPKYVGPRSVPYALTQKIDDELDRLEKENSITPVKSSEWATPIVPVMKSNGQVRICGDYKITLNPVLKVEKYPLPKTEDLFVKIAHGEKFTKLDCKHAYFQIPLDEESKRLTTISTHKGLYQVNRLPFGVTSASAIFQRAIESILSNLAGTGAFQDDIVVTGRNDQEHLRNLDAVMQALEESGLRLAKEKCHFMEYSIEYLGHVVDKKGIRPSPKKVEAILHAKTPTNLKELRSFLGLLNYYGKFIRNISDLLHPLHELLKKETKWKWTEACQRAFQQAKRKLSDQTMLAHYDPAAPLELHCDASSHGIGAVLQHIMPDQSRRPIAFASRTLTKSESNYSQIDKEALSLVEGVRKFHQYLFGRRFTLWTDHKPLVSIFNPSKGIPSTIAARMQRWAIILSGYDFEIKYISTDQNVVADTLSRLPMTTETSECDSKLDEVTCMHISKFEILPLTHKQINVETRRDKTLSKVLRMTMEGWPEQVDCDDLIPYFRRRAELTVELDCILWGTRVIIPERYRKGVLDELHQGHVGMTKMKGLARHYVWWPNLDKDIEEIVRSCHPCQEVKNEAPKVPIHPWEYPKKRWQRIHADFAGPFHGRTFLLTIDAYSKWPEVISMSSTTSAATIKVFRTLFARYGLPERVVTDNGTQFTAGEFRDFMLRNGVQQSFSPPNHPATNGAAENFVGTFKRSINASLKSGMTLDEACHKFVLAYRTTPHVTTGCTPAKLMTGQEFRTRFDLLRPSVQDVVKVKQTRRNDHLRKERHVNEGDTVWTRDYRPNRKWSKGTVSNVLGNRTYDVRLQDGSLWKRHIEQLRQNESQNKEKEQDRAEEDRSPSENDAASNATQELEAREPDSEAPTPETKRSSDAAKDRQRLTAQTSTGTELRRSTRPRVPPQRYGL